MSGFGFGFGFSPLGALLNYNPENDDDISLLASGRTGLSFVDSIDGNNISILTPTYRGYTGSQLIASGGTVERLFDGNSYTLFFRIKQIEDYSATTYPFRMGNEGSNTQRGFSMAIASGNWYTTLCNVTPQTSQTIQLTNPNTNFKPKGWVDVFIQINQVTKRLICQMRKYSDQTTVGTDINADISSWTFTQVDNYGKLRFDSNIFAYADLKKFTGIKTLSQCRDNNYVTDLQFYYPTLISGTDVSGNAYHMKFIGNTVSNKYYSDISTYCLDKGFTKYKSAGYMDLDVPNDFSGNPIVRAATTFDYYGSDNYLPVLKGKGNLTGHNFTDSYIGFNEASSAATELEIFDRSNTTIQEDVSRSSVYYNATSLATKCRYHISEVFPHNEVFSLLFKEAYKNRVFFVVDKNALEFRITEVFSSDTQKAGSELTIIKKYCQINSDLYIGATRVMTKISEAILRSFANYNIYIDAGTYSEPTVLSSFVLNFKGIGVVNWTSASGNSAIDTLTISKNCTFDNIIITRTAVNGCQPITIKSNSFPVFNRCTIYVPYLNSTVFNYAVYPLKLEAGSSVTFTQSKIDSINSSNSITVGNGSVFNFEGSMFRAQLVLSGTGKGNVITDEFWSSQPTNNFPCGFVGHNDSELYVNIRSKQIICNTVTGLEEANQGIIFSTLSAIYDNTKFTLTGNTIIGNIAVEGNNEVLFKDITTEYGHFWVHSTGAKRANTTVVTFDNCKIKLDCDNDILGLHIIEDTMGWQTRIINNSILEFTGHSGIWKTMGNPARCIGGLYMRDSEIIDNCNDNIPIGTNYPQIMAFGDGKIDIENSILTNKNSDGVGSNRCLYVTRVAGLSYNIRLKDVVFNNSEINAPCIELDSTIAYDENDYICQSGITKNATGNLFHDESGDSAASWAYLTANCPL